MASAYNLRVVFDDSVVRQDFRFDLENVPYATAMPLLLQMGHLFSIPLDPTSILIARDTPDNRQKLERLLEETIYVPGMTNEQMSDLGNVVRSIFDIKQATVQNSNGNVHHSRPRAGYQCAESHPR